MADNARETLLRALEHIDEAREEVTHTEGHTFLVVSWAHSVEGKTTCGWAATDDPPFMLAALLYRVAERMDEPPEDDENEDDDGA
mgnify:CR=1 FL=1